MFWMVNHITFSTVDKQLKEAQNQFSEMKINLQGLYTLFDLHGYGLLLDTDSFFEYNLAKKINNPQIHVIVRDEKGNILNENDLGRIHDFFSEVSFDAENLDAVYKLKINHQYNYHCLNFLVKFSSQNIYIQLLMNVDSEMALMNSYFKIILYAVFLGILLSGIASLVLSVKTLKPVEDILKKQTEFVQNVSHELRTPLTIIQAKQELLLQEPNAQIIDKSEEVMLTLNETKRLSKLTKDLMFLLKDSNLKINDLQKEDINLDEFMKTLVAPYQDIAMAQNKKVVLHLNFEKEIRLDSSKIHQLMIILLDNAIKYTESGDEIQIVTDLKDNKCVIEVKDTGIGISDEGLNRIFERFYREDRARSRETGGSGLGLSIANMIVKSHNGTIKAHHNIEKGTIFTIKLPR